MMLYSCLQAFNQFISASTVRELAKYLILRIYHVRHICDHVCLEIVKTVYHGLEICTN